MPENKINILCTGALNADRVLANGIQIDIIPFIGTQSISPEKLEAHVKPLLHQKATVIFTSVNAINAVASCITDQKPNWTIFCIGHNTRRAVENVFGAASIAGVADYGESLAEIIVQKPEGDTVIFFCGDQRRQELPNALQSSGIVVKEERVYRTLATPVKVEKKYDGILFFSPSAVQSFFSMNAVGPEAVLFSIGSTTADAIQEMANNRIISAEIPDKEALLKKAIEYFNK